MAACLIFSTLAQFRHNTIEMQLVNITFLENDQNLNSNLNSNSKNQRYIKEIKLLLVAQEIYSGILGKNYLGYR